MLGTLHKIGCRCVEGTVQSLAGVRLLSVLSWGRNVEGQCGIEALPLVTRPTVVMELHGSEVNSVSAGKLNSAAVMANGDCLTWGDGRAGKLGHGTATSMHAPCRVEALVGRAQVTDVSLGDQHSVFLDKQQSIWTCGENKEGQCGLGTPLDVIAQQHRSAYVASHLKEQLELQASISRRVRDITIPMNSPQLSETDKKYSHHLQSLFSTQQKIDTARANGSLGAYTRQGQSSSYAFVGLGGSGSTASSGSANSALGFGGFDMEGYFTASGLQPGQVHTPTRLGRDQHPLISMQHTQVHPPRGQQVPAQVDQEPDATVLGSQRIVSVSASRYYTAVATAAGEVWTFGACYNGALGSHMSWSTGAQKVSFDIASAFQEHGGAVAVAAGGTFCLALTATGRVVLWGKLGSPPPADSLGARIANNISPDLSRQLGSRVAAGVIPGLPPIKHIAAGQQHALLSDGERVWIVGRWLDANGKEAGTCSWHEPRQVLHLADQGINCLAAGSHSSAVVTGEGRLHLWGRLVDWQHGDNLLRQHATEDLLPEDLRWGWPGYGSDQPALVPELSGVKSVALGGWHALVLVD